MLRSHSPDRKSHIWIAACACDWESAACRCYGRLIDSMFAAMRGNKMTDEQAAGYFEPLETKFTVRLYPFLQPMVQLHEVDNYLLYEVEKAIFESARLSVHTFANEDLGHTYYLSKCVGYS